MFIKKKKITHMWRRLGTPQNFLLAFIDEPWKTWKIRILKKWKKIAGDIILLHMCTKKPQSYKVQFLRFGVTHFLCHLGHFLPFTPLPQQQRRKPKFWKNEKSIWRCLHFKLMQQKTQSNDDVCLLRYGVQQTIFLSF